MIKVVRRTVKSFLETYTVFYSKKRNTVNTELSFYNILTFSYNLSLCIYIQGIASNWSVQVHYMWPTSSAGFFDYLLPPNLCFDYVKLNYWTKCSELEKKVTTKIPYRDAPLVPMVKPLYAAIWNEYESSNASQFVNYYSGNKLLRCVRVLLRWRELIAFRRSSQAQHINFTSI